MQPISIYKATADKKYRIEAFLAGIFIAAVFALFIFMCSVTP